MKKLTKLVALLLALVMVLALFAGCTKPAEDKTPAPEENTPAQEEQHHHHIGGEGQGQKVGLGIKGQGHLLGVHQKQPEQLPHAPGQRSA